MIPTRVLQIASLTKRAMITKVLRHRVIRNIFALFGVQAAEYVFPLITVPYLARVLGPTSYGAVALGQAFAAWVALVIEYGFNLSATREVARQPAEARVEEMAQGVLGAKLLLFFFGAVLALISASQVSVFREMPSLAIWSLVQGAAQGFSPLWYYQGRERMGLPVALHISARAVSTVLIFLLVRQPSDGPVVLAVGALTGLSASAVSYLLLYREVKPKWPTLSATVNALREGADLFLFRASVSLYTTANAFILGLMAPPTAVALYSGAEKVSKATRGLLRPLSQALYPRMSALVHNNPERAREINRLSFVVIVSASAVLGGAVALGAPLIVRVLFGVGYEDMVPVLRVLCALIPIVGASNVLGIQWMLPLRLDREFTRIILTAGMVNVGLALLLASRFGALGMAATAVATESYVTLAMFVTLAAKSKLSLFQRRQSA